MPERFIISLDITRLGNLSLTLVLKNEAADRLSERPAAHLQYIRLSYNIVDNFWSTILRKVAVNDQKELKLICFNLPLNSGLRAVAIICHKQLALVQTMYTIQAPMPLPSAYF